MNLRATHKKKSDQWDIECIVMKFNTSAYTDEPVPISTLEVLAITVADSMSMAQNYCNAVWWPKMEAQILLTLLWLSFLRGSSDIVSGFFT